MHQEKFSTLHYSRAEFCMRPEYVFVCPTFLFAEQIKKYLCLPVCPSVPDFEFRHKIVFTKPLPVGHVVVLFVCQFRGLEYFAYIRGIFGHHNMQCKGQVSILILDKNLGSMLKELFVLFRKYS